MHQDANGNVITIVSGQVKLHLKGMKPRLIGVIDDKEQVLIVKRTRHEHLMNVNNSYGFNDFCLRNAKRFDKVRIEDDYGCWQIPTKFILEYGTHLHFKQKNFELQIFINLNYLPNYIYGTERNTEKL